MTELKKGPYSDEENAFITKHYAEKGPKWCGEQLGRPAANLQVRAHYMGLTMRDRRGGGFKDNPITKPKPEKPRGDVINPLPAQKALPPPLPRLPWPSLLKCEAALQKKAP